MESGNLISKIKVEKNQLKSVTKYENIKSKYILQKIFNNLEKKRTLILVKYNKDIKNRLDINFNDYKDCLEKYSSIVIEIKPAKNIIGKFIDIRKEDEKYYHIYFNNNEKEIKRNYINKDEEIKITIDYQVISFKNLFKDCKCIESINFKKFYRNNIIDMSGMFYNCSSLKELNLSNFNTSNVTNMSTMFSFCSSLKELNLSNFNTNNVTEMCGMFSNCSSLKELNLNNFNTDNVTNMNLMFFKCSSLEELNLNNFNTNNVTDKNIIGIFDGCSKKLIKKIKTQYKSISKKAFLI